MYVLNSIVLYISVNIGIEHILFGIIGLKSFSKKYFS